MEMVSANPTGPITVAAARNGAYGDSVARLLEFAGHEVEREYYYNDAGAQMDRFRASVEARRRGEEPPEDGYQGDYIAELAKLPDDPVPAMLRTDRGDAGALPDPLRLVGEAERARAAAARVPAAPRHVREGRRRLGALVRVRGRGRPRADPLRGRSADLPGRRRRLPRRQARPRPRPRDLRARRRPPRHAQLVRGRRADARLRPGPGRGAALPARAPDEGRRGRRRCRSGAATSSSSTTSSTRSGVDAARWYLVSRGHDQAIEIDVDLAAEKSAVEPGLLRPVRARPDRRDPAERRRRRAVRGASGRARRRGARPDQAAGRVPRRSSPRRPSGAARTRSRPTRSASPTTSIASTTTTRCSAPRRSRSASASSPRRSR